MGASELTLKYGLTLTFISLYLMRRYFNFTNMLTLSFYTRRSQKCKKTVKSSVEKKIDQLVVLLYFSGFVLYVVCSNLVKLTRGVSNSQLADHMIVAGCICEAHAHHMNR